MSMVASSVLLLGAPVPPHIKVAGAADVNPGSGRRARRSSPAAVSVLEEPVDRVGRRPSARVNRRQAPARALGQLVSSSWSPDQAGRRPTYSQNQDRRGAVSQCPP